MKKLNWIDILLIVVLVGALAFGAYTVLGPDNATDEVQQDVLSVPTMEMIVEIPEISRELADNAVASLDGEPKNLDGTMVPMTRLYNSNKLVDAEITDCEILETEDENVVTLRLTIAANPTIYRCNYTVGTQEVRLGKSFIAKTMSIELTGTVVSLTELGNE